MRCSILAKAFGPSSPVESIDSNTAAFFLDQRHRLVGVLWFAVPRWRALLAEMAQVNI